MSPMARAIAVLALLLTYAWLLALLSLAFVELVVMRCVAYSPLRTAIGLGVYAASVALWYETAKLLLERELRKRRGSATPTP